MTTRLACVDDLSELVLMVERMHAESPVYRDQNMSLGNVAGALVDAMCEHRLFVVGPPGLPHSVLMAGTCQPWWAADVEGGDMLLYVSPEKRGTRAFFQLIRRFEAWGHSEGLRKLTISSSSGINPEKTARVLIRAGYRFYAESFAKTLPGRA